MTPDELARACIAAMTSPGQLLRDQPVVGVAGSRKVPFPKKSFPKWKYLSFDLKGKPVYHYPAKELFAALAYHGMIDIRDYQEEVNAIPNY